MWVEEADMQEELEHLLEQAKVDGYNWVAFDQADEAQFHPSLVHFFKLVIEAEEFCEVDYYEWLDTFDPTRQEQRYQYTSIDTLQHVLRADSRRLELTAPQDCEVSIHPANFIKYNSITIKNSIIMNTQNLDYLKESLKYAGFDKLLNEQLQKNIEDKLPEFQLSHNTKIGEDAMNYTLHFRRSDTEEKYYFNTMDATLKKPGENEMGVSQTFYQNQNITAKEAYNLLDGRAVNKTYFKHEKIGEGDDAQYKRTDQTYNTWLELDFSKKDKHENFEINRYNEKYGFNVERSLKELSLKDLDDTQSVDRLVKSLKRGNLIEAVANNNGTSEKVSLAANPKERTLDAYDADMNKLDIKSLKLTNKANRESVSEEVTQKNEQKKGLKH